MIELCLHSRVLTVGLLEWNTRHQCESVPASVGPEAPLKDASALTRARTHG